MADHPLAGVVGKPLIGVPSSNQIFVGRIIIELFENTQSTVEQSKQVEADASSIALSVSPGLGTNTTKTELLQRLAASFPLRAAKEIQLEERRRKIAQDQGGIYE